MSGQGASAERVPLQSPVAPRRATGGVVPIPVYDVRVRRELAHRRFVVSILRQALRLISLHALDAAAVIVAFFVARQISNAEVAVSLQALPALVAFVLVGLNV